MTTNFFILFLMHSHQ